MALTLQEKTDLLKDFMKILSRSEEPINVTKPDLTQMIDDVDNWIDANQASFTAALSPIVQANTTGNQKARIFMMIAQKRFQGA